MCGIAGAVALIKNSIQVDQMKPMVDILSHRGPDDAGYLFVHTGCRHDKKINFHLDLTDQEFQSQSKLLPSIDDNESKKELNSHDWDLFFGHRRLSIIDTTDKGHQPMSDLAKKIWVVYNGEIYNFKELRQQLIEKGYAFKTSCDTEVLIYSYAEWGIECIQKFNGMFAFTLYDANTNKLFLARDRYGVKPLHYCITKTGTLLFASEEKGIQKHPEYEQEIDLEAVYEYFTFQNIFTDKTFNKGIKLLPAGTFMEFDLRRKSIQPEVTQYWDFNFQKPETIKDEREYIEELERLFQQAVKRQLVSDVELGCYLSGGMDSGSITAVAASQIKDLKTFTIGFDMNNVSGLELAFDERAKAEHLSYLYKTEHYQMVLKSGDMERCLPKFAWHLETPRVGQSYPNYYAAKLASKFVKVVLSGTGGDELFAGYPWRYYQSVANSSFENYIDNSYSFWQRLTTKDELKDFFSPIWDEIKSISTKDVFRQVYKSRNKTTTDPEDYVNHSLYFEAKTFLHGLLQVEDRLSMAHSLETRVPFLDNDLVDFSMRVPASMKLGKAGVESSAGNKKSEILNKRKDGKIILRKALSKLLPEGVTTRKKQGFSSPDNTWFKGDSMSFVANELSKKSPIYSVFEYKIIHKIILEHSLGKENKRLLIWGLLNFNQWIKTNKSCYDGITC